jgi:LysM repeat protein
VSRAQAGIAFKCDLTTSKGSETLMLTKRMFMTGLLIALLMGTLVIVSPAPTQAQQQNLLANPGFEPPYEGGVASYWQAWYEDSGELCETRPDGWDFVCRPNWSQETDPNGHGLTRGGSSQHVGVQYITWHGGVFQTVEVAPGTKVRFTVFGYSFASNENLPASSYGQNWVGRMKVGIDPEGRGQWTQGVIWSGENNAMDSWQQLSVEATAGASGKVTVFVSSQYRNAQPLAHMDSWWDNATLEVVQPAATPTFTPQPTSAVPPTPVNTPTPRPDGAVVHVVQSGDTLYGIALQYDVDVDELRRLNAGTLGANDMLSVGQELVISAASVTPTATPAPTQEATPEPTQEAGGEGGGPAAPTGDVGSVCVSAYHDRNEDMTRQPGEEELLPNATFTLVGTDGPAGNYTSDGISEPYCFENLKPGNYVLRQTPPAGYAPTGPEQWGVPLSAGQAAALELGYLRTGVTSPQETETPAADPSQTEDEQTSTDSPTNVINLILRISGIVVLVLALLVAGLFVISRRR